MHPCVPRVRLLQVLTSQLFCRSGVTHATGVQSTRLRRPSPSNAIGHSLNPAHRRGLWTASYIHEIARRQLPDLRRTMAASSFQDIKEIFLTMPLEEKRKHYFCKANYVPIEKIPTWPVYFRTKCNDPLSEDDTSHELNNKVSLWSGDITALEIDAIANAANTKLQGGAGVDGAIHRAADRAMLQEECRSLNGCPVGEAKLTGGYKLPAKYVIQTVGPMGEKPDKLKSCYVRSLELAVANNLRTVAFPCISTGVYGYPQEAAAKVAISSVKQFLQENPDKLDRVIFCVFLDDDKYYYENILQEYFPVE